jgi:Trypsin
MRQLAIIAVLVGLAGCAADVVGSESDEDLGTSREEITGGEVAYTPGLLRIDYPGGGRCSGFLVGPNMIATAAHCVNDRTISGTHDGVWNGMKWAEIKLRFVYKPSHSEVMCINETCRNADGSTRYTTVLAFWDDGYSYDVETTADVAIITRLAGGDFLTRQADPGDPAARALHWGDFHRILAVSMPDGYAYMRGYGAYVDSDSDEYPREGIIPIDAWGTNDIRGEVSFFLAAACAGDSGGPLLYSDPSYSYDYVAGIASRTSARTGDCPEVDDNIWWARLSAKKWMLDRVLEWSGRNPCTEYADGDLPGNGHYYRCW